MVLPEIPGSSDSCIDVWWTVIKIAKYIHFTFFMLFMQYCLLHTDSTQVWQNIQIWRLWGSSHLKLDSDLSLGQIQKRESDRSLPFAFLWFFTVCKTYIKCSHHAAFQSFIFEFLKFYSTLREGLWVTSYLLLSLFLKNVSVWTQQYLQ